MRCGHKAVTGARGSRARRLNVGHCSWLWAGIPSRRKRGACCVSCGHGSEADTRGEAQGGLLVFDDSFEHEVWHRGRAPRAVLLFNFVPPWVSTLCAPAAGTGEGRGHR
jgi:hypothetical protein